MAPPPAFRAHLDWAEALGGPSSPLPVIGLGMAKEPSSYQEGETGTDQGGETVGGLLGKGLRLPLDGLLYVTGTQRPGPRQPCGRKGPL